MADCLKGLSEIIAPEDLGILRQRIVLLNKQWQETGNQIMLRKQEIEYSLNEWTTFDERYEYMCDWLDIMKLKVSSNREYHIEELIVKLQRDYQDEMSDMLFNKDNLIQHGKRLIPLSNRVEATDIRNKIAQLADRWQQMEEFCSYRYVSHFIAVHRHFASVMSFSFVFGFS